MTVKYFVCPLTGPEPLCQEDECNEGVDCQGRISLGALLVAAGETPNQAARFVCERDGGVPEIVKAGIIRVVKRGT